MASRRSHAPTNTSRLSMSCGFLSPASRNHERVRWRLFHSCAPSVLAVGFWWIRVPSGRGMYKVAYYTAPAMVGCGATARRHSLLCLYCCLFRDKGDIKTKKRVTQMSNSFFLWCHQESNRGHKDFQSFALPSELWHQLLKKLDFFLASAKVVLLFRSAKYFGNFFQIISFPWFFCLNIIVCQKKLVPLHSLLRHNTFRQAIGM